MPGSLPALPALRAKVRTHFAGLKRGDRDALDHWRCLANLLLHATVAEDSEGVRLSRPSKAIAEDDKAFLEGLRGEPVRLRSGRFLRVWQSLAILEDPGGQGPRVKVLSSSYQYQSDLDGREWLFRFDYERQPQNQYPGAHLQVHGAPFVDGWMPDGCAMKDVHFPTHRVSLEAVLRLLIEDFGVPPARPSSVWRAVLAESERAFREIAHAPSPGPEK